jgi:hypothetical protein
VPVASITSATPASRFRRGALRQHPVRRSAPTSAAKLAKPWCPGSSCRQSCTSLRALPRSPRWRASRACRKVSSGPARAGWLASHSYRIAATRIGSPETGRSLRAAT